MSESPYQSPISPEKTQLSDYGNNDLLAYFEPLYRRRIWAKITGVVFMIVGGLYTLTIIGAIAGVPIFLIGYNFFQASDHLEHGFAGQQGRLREASERISLGIMIFGILVLIWVIFMILYLLFVFLMIGASFTLN